MPRTRLFSSLILVTALALTGCGTELRRPDTPDPVVQQERAAQLRLAKEIKAKRLARLNRIRAKLVPQARNICAKVLDRSAMKCIYSLELVDDASLNAAADGNKIYINTGMLRFLESDDEIAIVLGHEMAHNMLDHINKKRGSMIVGAIIDAVIQGATGVYTGGAFQQAGALAYSQDYEEEADYLGLYLAARAGYDISVAPTLWRRMAIENPKSISRSYAGTHPSTPERAVALRKAVEEVELKRSAGLALQPIKADHTEAHGNSFEDVETAIAGTSTDSHSSGRTTLTPTQQSAPNKEALNAIGEWNYQAELFAEEQGCSPQEKGRPPAYLLKTENFTEYYESPCPSHGGPLHYHCTNVGCVAN